MSSAVIIAMNTTQDHIMNSYCPAVFEILGSKHIRVTILTFQGHVTSSVT